MVGVVMGLVAACNLAGCAAAGLGTRLNQRVPDTRAAGSPQQSAAPYGAFRVGDGAWSARNRAHGLEFRFDERGVEARDARMTQDGEELFRIGLAELTRGGESIATGAEAPALRGDGQRVEIQHAGLVEWYANGPRGLEHGFDLPTRPPGSGELQLGLALSSARATLSGDEVALHTPSGRRLAYAKLEVLDARGERVPSRFAVPDPETVLILVDDREAVYPLRVDPVLSASDWDYESNDLYASLGFAVASAGDVNGDDYDDVIVSAPFSGLQGDGAAFIFHGSASGLPATPDRSLLREQTADGVTDWFGYAVASGDVNGDDYDDVIVGAPNARPDGPWQGTSTGRGAVEVYLGSASGLSATPDWWGTSVYALWFGFSVAAGDVNGDGYDDVIVGAPLYGPIPNPPENGAVVIWLGGPAGAGNPSGLGALGVFDREGVVIGGGNQYASVLTSVEDAWLGWSLAVLEDSSGLPSVPRHDDILVGAPRYEHPFSRELGGAFVVDGNMLEHLPGREADVDGTSIHGVWGKFFADASSSLGWSVGNAGDLDGDGRDDPIVGAPSYAGGGHAFAWLLNTGGEQTTAQAHRDLSVEAGFGNFGLNVASAGDVNDDGYRDVVVVDRHTEAGFQNLEARVHLFLGSEAGLSSEPIWTTETSEGVSSGGLYGPMAVASSAGDVNGDEIDDFLVGAPGYANGQDSEGQALVWHGWAFDVLRVERAGEGGGTVASDPPGIIYCGINCDEILARGTEVTLTASPNGQSAFAGWSGACTGTDLCALTVGPGASSVTAHFDPVYFHLRVSRAGVGGGSVTSVYDDGIDCGSDCDEDYLKSSHVTLEANPDTGFIFSGWSGDCVAEEGNRCWMPMDRERSVMAHFEIGLTVSVTGTGSGTVGIEPPGIDCADSCTEVYAPGAVVDLTPNAAAGSLFAGFGGDPDCADGQVTLDVSRTCIASFDLPGGWAARYDGSGNGEDEATALALGPGGEVVVVGESEGDFAIVKYDADGGELWARRYDGPDADLDKAVAVVVDQDGNVYATGQSTGSGTGYDYATIKYDASGDHQWTRRYDGPGHGYDEPKALAVDDDGNVYVTGWSTGAGTSSDYATVKYNPHGAQLWVRRYDSPGEYSGTDGAQAVALDAARNVYVTGGSSSGDPEDMFNFDLSDYATIKYAPNGDEVWAARYDHEYDWEEARAITVDDQGYAHVTGRGQWGSLTIQYAPDGTPRWTTAGPGGDGAYALALDRWGNVCAAGRYTIKYDPDGNELWRADNGGTAKAIAVDPAGNVFVTGWIRSGSYDLYLTIQYDLDGNRVWDATYDGAGTGHDRARGLAIDAAGDVIVTGGAQETGSRNFVTLKYAGIAEPVPEPSRTLLYTFALATLVLLRRRRAA